MYRSAADPHRGVWSSFGSWRRQVVLLARLTKKPSVLLLSAFPPPTGHSRPPTRTNDLALRGSLCAVRATARDEATGSTFP